jgi:hypothetical protein
MKKKIKDENWLEETIKEYGSLERYIEQRYNQGADPLIKGYAPFRYLLEKGLLKEDDIIRTNLEGGFRDGHYRITREGELEGVEAAGGSYSGDPGVHNSKEYLSLKKADNGWTLGSFARMRVVVTIEKTG